MAETKEEVKEVKKEVKKPEPVVVKIPGKLSEKATRGTLDKR